MRACDELAVIGLAEQSLSLVFFFYIAFSAAPSYTSVHTYGHPEFIMAAQMINQAAAHRGEKLLRSSSSCPPSAACLSYISLLRHVRPSVRSFRCCFG